MTNINIKHLVESDDLAEKLEEAMEDRKDGIINFNQMINSIGNDVFCAIEEGIQSGTR